MCWCQTEWKPIRKNSFARCSSLWFFIFHDKYLHHLLHSTSHSFYGSFDSIGPDLSWWRSSLWRKMQLLKEVESISWRTVKIRKRPWTGDQNSMGRKSEETDLFTIDLHCQAGSLLLPWLVETLSKAFCFFLSILNWNNRALKSELWMCKSVDPDMNSVTESKTADRRSGMFCWSRC